MVNIIEKYKRKTSSFSYKALALTAALCMCMTAAGCGDKTKDNTSSMSAQSIVSVVETKDTAVSKEGNSAENTTESKTESKSTSKSESKTESTVQSKTEKTVSAAADTSTVSKSEEKTSSENTQTTENKTENKSESKAENKAESKAESKATAKNTDGFSSGQTIVLDIRFGGININGEPAKIGAYDYWIEYDQSALEYVESVEQTKSDMQLVNDDEIGKLKIAHIAAMGFKDDFTGKKKSTYKVYFKAKKDMKDVKEMGITCKCPSLTAVSMDGKDTFTLINAKTPQDRYSEYSITAE